MSLVERIKGLCSSKNTTLIGLEREIEIGRGTIRNWDTNSPSVDKLQKVADYFKVSTDYLLVGFERTLLVQLINYVKNDRSIEQFAQDTGVDLKELSKLCLGLVLEQPSRETIEKIASSNPIDFLVDRVELLNAAGYFEESPDKKTTNTITLAAHRPNGYDEPLTEDEAAAVSAYLKIYREQKKKG